MDTAWRPFLPSNPEVAVAVALVGIHVVDGVGGMDDVCSWRIFGMDSTGPKKWAWRR